MIFYTFLDLSGKVVLGIKIHFNMKILFVSSGTKKMFDLTGKNMISSFFHHNPDQKLLFTTECYSFDNSKYNNLLQYDIMTYPFLLEWLEKFSYLIPTQFGGSYDHCTEKYSYMSPKTKNAVASGTWKGDWNYKASLWFRKIASLHYAYEIYKQQYDVIVWIDCDSTVNQSLANTSIQTLLNGKEFFCIFNIARLKHDYGIESGFCGWRTDSNFLPDLFQKYISGAFELYSRWDDGYVIRKLIEESYVAKAHLIVSSNLVTHIKGIHWRTHTDYERD